MDRQPGESACLIESDTAVLRNFLPILSDHSRFLTSRVQQFALQTLSSRLIGYLEKNPAVQNLQETAFILASHAPPCRGRSPSWSARESCAKAKRGMSSRKAAGRLQPFSRESLAKSVESPIFAAI